MGLRIFKPIKIPIIFNIKNVDNNQEKVVQNQTEVSKTIDEISQFILLIVDEIYNKHFSDIDNLSNDLLVRDLCPRTNRKRPIDRVENEALIKIQKLESDIKFFSDIYSFDELVEILKECSNHNDNLDAIYDTKENIDRPLITVVLQGNEDDINTLTKSELETLFENKILFELSEKKDLSSKLKLLLNKAAKYGIIAEFIDNEDDNSNPAISIALLNSNFEAFCYLIKRHAKIPRFIYLKEQKIPFLNYIAMNGKIRKNNTKNDYILSEILNTLINNYGKEYITEYLCDIDKNSGLSLPHLLLIQYQNSPDLKLQITSCLKLCIDNCPESLKVMCTSVYCNVYKFNVIAHSIILPNTNFEILKAFMNLDNTAEELLIYKSLVMVHPDPCRRQELLKIID